MAINYDALQTKAEKLLEDNGQSITFSYTSGAVIDPATGVVSDSGSTETVSGFGIATNFQKAEIDGEAVLASDIRLIANNVAEEPEPDWTVVVNSKTFRVMSVQQINPAGTNIIYICQLRI